MNLTAKGWRSEQSRVYAPSSDFAFEVRGSLPEASESARRITAAMNACAEISTLELELLDIAGAIDESTAARSQRDRLASALQHIVRVGTDASYDAQEVARIRGALVGIARSALAAIDRELS